MNTNTQQPAPSGSLHPICSAWWMYDNHTFQPVDVTQPKWREYVMTCYDIDGYGSFFVRESPNGKTIFDLHGRGKEGRESFAAALNAWTPPNAQDQTREPTTMSNTDPHFDHSLVRLCRFCAKKLGLWMEWKGNHCLYDHATSMPCEKCNGENLRNPESHSTVRLRLPNDLILPPTANETTMENATEKLSRITQPIWAVSASNPESNSAAHIG